MNGIFTIFRRDISLSCKPFILLILLTPCCSAYGQPTGNLPGQLTVAITDSVTMLPVAVRVRITTKNKVVRFLPKEAVSVMYGVWDHADGYGFQPDSSFYVDGGFSLQLPQGEYSIFLSRGIEYLDQQHNINIENGKQLQKSYNMVRWINMPERNWFSADDHIHIRRSPREDSLVMKWIRAEDIHVGVLLRMGDFWATYYEQYGWGKNGIFQQGDFFLTSGQEDPRTPEVGHTIGIGASDKVRYQNEYYYYDKVFDRLHELGGLTGYAHHAESFHGYRGLIMDGLRKKVDMLELLQFCVSQDPLQTRHYYHLLDLGYAVTAIAGSDFPWCGRKHDDGRPERNARIGNARFYTKISGALNFDSWRTSLKKGHTFVTSGPMISLTVNNKLPGDTLKVKKGASLKIAAHADGHSQQVPLQRLELIRHGEVIASATADDQGQSSSQLTLEINAKAGEGGWLAARCYAGEGQAAHTTPVYVSVDNGGFHNRKKVVHYLDLAEAYLMELEKEIGTVNNNPQMQGWRYRSGLEKRIAEVRIVLKQLESTLK